MGGEHSREAAPVGEEVSEAPESNLEELLQEDDVLGRDSPRPSICSDGDVPYIPYTVNRPIGDSPKHVSKATRSLRSVGGGSLTREQKKAPPRPPEVVVVKERTANKTSIDPDLARLQCIPTFLPIMRAALTAPSARDPEVLERLDVSSMSDLCSRLQRHLHLNASFISSHQDKLTAHIVEVDGIVTRLVSKVTERQRSYARYAERLSQVTEVSHLLTRCHATLNLVLESMEVLNNTLPLDDRLEPFIWTTG